MTRSIWILALTGCNSLLGIPGSGEVGPPGDGMPGDVSTVGNCQADVTLCAVHAADRGIAQSPEQIVLEGTFGDEVTVQFPGLSGDVPATLLGAHRVRVAVPPNANDGLLQVTTVGTLFATVPFRATSYRLGVTHFQIEYPQTTSARLSPKLVTARGGAATLAIGDQVFVIGGRVGDGTPRDDIEIARINADGTLGQFVRSSTIALVTPRTGASIHLIGNRVYVLGGAMGNNNALASVETAAFDPDTQKLGSFTTVQQSPLTTPRAGHVSIVIGDGLFVLGGNGPDGVGLTSVERAPINPDGSLGAFEIVAGITLRSPRVTPALVAIRDSLYVIGGSPGANQSGTTTIDRAIINGSGELEAFTDGGLLKIPRAAPSAIALGDKIVVMGGLGNGLIVEDSVEQSKVEMDGQLGAFSMLPGRMGASRAGAGLVIAGNNLHLIGGLTVAGTTPVALASVEHTSLLVDGGIDAFGPGISDVTAPPRSVFTADVFGRDVLLVGGTLSGGQSSGIAVSQVKPAVGLGVFTEISVGTLTPRTSHRSAIAGDFMHVIGGTDTGAQFSRQTQTATFGPTGLGTFTNGKQLAQGRTDFTTAFVNDQFFVFGGQSANVTRNDVESTFVGANGSLGSGVFNTESSIITGARRSHCSAVIGPFIYLVGGASGTGGAATLLGDVVRASFAGGLSNFAPVSGVAVGGRGSVTCAVLGKFLYVFGSNAAGGKTIERAEIFADTFDISTFTPIAVSMFEVRFEHRAIELGNEIQLIGGNNGTGVVVNTTERATLR